MKKCILIVFCIIYTSYIFSQEVRIGIFAEPKINWLTPDVKNINSDGSTMGFNIGLMVDKYFTKNYAFATGLSINNTGGKLVYTESIELATTNAVETIDPNTSVRFKLQYVTIPLGLKLKTNPMGYLSFTSNIGATPQINIKAKAESEENDIQDENISEEINIFNLGYHIGGGIEYSIGGNSAISVSIIYTNGFLDITAREEDKINLSNVALKIGVIF